jgi:hypothetical protein
MTDHDKKGWHLFTLYGFVIGIMNIQLYAHVHRHHHHHHLMLAYGAVAEREK